MPAKITDIDQYCRYLATDDDELLKKHVEPIVIARIHRMRALYAYWLQFPTKSNKEIVNWNMTNYGISDVQAYEDLHLVQLILGNLQQASKDFMRWKINQDLEEDLKNARRIGDMRAVALLEKNRILNNRTDKDDELELEYEKIIPQTFEPTNDPAVLGINTWQGKLPQLKERVAVLIKKYNKDAVQEAEYLEMEEDDDEE